MTRAHTIQEYRVKWEMDIEAASPREAARIARQYQQDPAAMVGCFTVVNATTGEGVDVDLDA